MLKFVLINASQWIAANPTHLRISCCLWNEVTIDTEFGTDRSGQCHCVLVAVDTFIKWVEVAPLCG